MGSHSSLLLAKRHTPSIDRSRSLPHPWSWGATAPIRPMDLLTALTVPQAQQHWREAEGRWPDRTPGDVRAAVATLLTADVPATSLEQWLAWLATVLGDEDSGVQATCSLGELEGPASQGFLFKNKKRPLAFASPVLRHCASQKASTGV